MKMKTKMKNLITITSIIVFSMIAIASSEDNSKVNNEEATEENPMDNIDNGGGGGNSDYAEDLGDGGSYDYTEDCGDGWTLYHAYKPSQSTSDCNSKKCNRCPQNYNADDVEFKEYPSNSIEAAWDLAREVEGVGSKDNVDMENKRIYSSWTVKCIYNYGDYCSRECSEEY
jgi:hypothetical protein